MRGTEAKGDKRQVWNSILGVTFRRDCKCVSMGCMASVCCLPLTVTIPSSDFIGLCMGLYLGVYSSRGTSPLLTLRQQQIDWHPR